jgi:predicted nucleic acid-binding protein
MVLDASILLKWVLPETEENFIAQANDIGAATKEPEVLAAQGIAPAVPKLTLRSGDGKLVKISQTLLDEGPAGLWTANVAQ